MKRKIQLLLFIALILTATAACSSNAGSVPAAVNIESTPAEKVIEQPVAYQLPSGYTESVDTIVQNGKAYFRDVKVDNEYKQFHLSIKNMLSEEVNGTKEPVTDEDLKSCLIKLVTESDKVYNASLPFNDPGFKRPDDSIIEKEVDGKKYIFTYSPYSKSNFSYIGLYRYNNEVAMVVLYTSPTGINQMTGDIMVPTQLINDFYYIMENIVKNN